MNHNILYSFRRCPYAMRARWAIIDTHQKVIIREISLKNKAPEFILASSKATVPVLVTKEKIIDESLDIMRWAIQRSNRSELLQENNHRLKSEILDLIQQNDNTFKYHLDRYKYASRYKNTNAELHQEEAMRFLNLLNSRIRQFKGFLTCKNETLADWAIWPFVRQFRIADTLFFDHNSEINHLKRWLNQYLLNNTFEVIMKKYKIWDSSQRDEMLGH